VLHRIGEGPWRSSIQPTRLSLLDVVKSNGSRSSKHSLKKEEKNTEFGEVDLQMKEHGYVHKAVDQIYLKKSKFGVVKKLVKQTIKTKR